MKTVKVRIAVAVDPTGRWCAFGIECDSGDESMDCAVAEVGPSGARYFVTAELPVPEQVEEVKGEVEEVK